MKSFQLLDISSFYPTIVGRSLGKTMWLDDIYGNAFVYRARNRRDRWFLNDYHWDYKAVGKSFRNLRKIAEADEKEFMNRFGSLRKITDEQMVEIREFLIKAAEKEFKRFVEPYPFHFAPNQPDDLEGQLAVIEKHEAWLAENFAEDRYLAYPTEAVGEFKECCRNVYFKNMSDLVLFKLSVC